MAYQLNGVDQYIEFGVGALSATLAGPTTMAVCVNLDATTDGAAIHLLTSGNASGAFLECFGSWDMGIGATARVGPAGVTGSWRVIVFSKPTGTASVEWTQIILGGATTSGTATGGTLGDGSTPPGGTGKIRVGRFQNSATEYVNGKIAAAAVFTSYMNQAAREALTTWAAWQAAGFAWGVEMQSLSALTDASGNGGNETGRFGTASITLVADPAGFFAGGGTDVDIDDTSGGGTAGGSTETVSRGVVLTDSSGGGTAASSTQTVLRGVTVADGSGGGSAGSTPTPAPSVGVTLADASGGATAGSTPTPAPVVGVGVGDTSGGGTAGSSGQAVTSGVVLTDSSGGGSAGGSPDTAGSGTFLTDGSGGGSVGGSVDGVVRGVLIQDVSGGGTAGSSAGTVTAVVLLADRSGGASAGGSVDVVFSPTDVMIGDASGGASAGGSPDTAATSEVVHDMMVMPVLLNALTCLQAEMAKVETPPAIFTLRPGADMEPSADPWMDECCAGVAWVRMVSSYESGSEEFPEPTTRPLSNGCPPDSWAVVIEVGVYRCVPVAGDTKGSIVTPAQWLAATQAQMDDGAALRRVLCCLRDVYDTADVTSGQVNPLPLQAYCGGISMQITVRRDACDTC